MVFDPSRVVHEHGELVDDLNGLVESWYEKADAYHEQGLDADYHAYRECADQLAKTIEESGN